MNNYIENLKTKPEHIKKRFAFLVSFSFSALILVGWIASYGFVSNSVVANSANGDATTTIDTPVTSVTASVIGAYDDLKNIIFGSNKTEYSAPTVIVEAGPK